MENNKDENIRMEFAKAFNWKKAMFGYSEKNEYIVPSWEQIFVQVGILLASGDLTKLQNRIDELEMAQDKFSNELYENKYKSN